MSNRTVAIEADKVRNLKLGTYQMVKAEEMLGRPLTQLSKDTMYYGDFPKILHVALQWEDKDLTFEQTCDIMDTIIENKGMEYLSEKISKVMEQSTGSSFPNSKKN